MLLKRPFNDLSRWPSALFSTLTPFPPSSAPLFSSAPGLTFLPHEKLSQSSDEEVVFFSHYAGAAVYEAFVDFDAASTAAPVETTTLALARFDSGSDSISFVLNEKDFRRGRRQKVYSEAFGQFSCSATTPLEGAIRHFAEYWDPEKFEVDTQSVSFKLCKKLVFNMFCRATRIVSIPLLSKKYLAIDAHWSDTFVSSKLGRTHNCLVAEFADKTKSIIRLGSNRPYPSLSSAVIGHLIQ